MEPMQDKEFDQFFKDKLGQAEVSPPAMLWAKVEGQLEPKRKKTFPIYWMAAAMAVVAVSAALLFNQQEKIQLQGQSDVLSQVEKPVSEGGVETPARESLVPATSAEGTMSSTGKQAVVNTVKGEPKKELLAMQPSGVQLHLDDSRHDVKQAQEEAFLVPEAELARVISPAEETVLTGIEERHPQENALTDEQEAQPERRGIRNVGDLVNLVVNKIDKREEKILQFNDNDEDQSSLVSVNIGIIKFNTKQREKK